MPPSPSLPFPTQLFPLVSFIPQQLIKSEMPLQPSSITPPWLRDADMKRESISVLSESTSTLHNGSEGDRNSLGPTHFHRMRTMNKVIRKTKKFVLFHGSCNPTNQHEPPIFWFKSIANVARKIKGKCINSKQKNNCAQGSFILLLLYCLLALYIQGTFIIFS